MRDLLELLLSGLMAWFCSTPGTGYSIDLPEAPKGGLITLLSEAGTYRYSTDEPAQANACGISFSNPDIPFQLWTVGVTHFNTSGSNTSISNFT